LSTFHHKIGIIILKKSTTFSLSTSIDLSHIISFSVSTLQFSIIYALN